MTDGSIDISLRAKDPGAGVDRVEVSYRTPQLHQAFLMLSRVSGSAADGRWTGEAKVLRCVADAGRWTVAIFMLDRAGNVGSYTSEDLTDLGFPSRVAVRANDTQLPSATGPQGTITADGDITVRFSEKVNGINADSAALVLNAFSDNPVTLPGTWTCTTRDGADTSCATGEVRRATFDPESDLLPGQDYLVVLNPEHQLSITDLAGNPFDRYFVNVIVV
jgi:hypothetical protein